MKSKALLEDGPHCLHRGQRRTGTGHIDDADAFGFEIGLDLGVPVVAGIVQYDYSILGVGTSDE